MMKRYEIKKLQEEIPHGWSICSEVVLFTDHEKAIKQAVAAEREAFMEIIETEIDEDSEGYYQLAYQQRCFAAAIRKRGEK